MFISNTSSNPPSRKKSVSLSSPLIQFLTPSKLISRLTPRKRADQLHSSEPSNSHTTKSKLVDLFNRRHSLGNPYSKATAKWSSSKAKNESTPIPVEYPASNITQNPFVESYASLTFAGPDTMSGHSSGSCSCSSHETAGSTSSLGLSEIYLGSCSDFEFIEAHTSTPQSSPDHDCEAPIHSSARSRLTYARSNECGWVVLDAAVEAPSASGVPKAPALTPTSQWCWPIGATIQGIGMEWVVIDNIDLYSPKEEDPGNRTITSPLSGTTYSIHTLIGRGAFAEVVRARTDRGEDVAIKINRKSTIGADSLKANSQHSYIQTDRDLIIQERDILVRIAELSTHTGNAPFLANMHECFQDATHVYFVMPLYVSNIGEHCRLYLPPGIERPRLTRGQIRIWAAELLLGLEALHKLGVVHRDLKPENILITSTGHLAIADFGLSAVFPPFSTTSSSHNQQSHTSQLAATATPFSARRMYEHCGTPGYFAPEVCHAQVEEHGYDASVDIYGFGVILLEMATGTRCAGSSLRAAGRYAAAREFQRNVGAYLDLQFGRGEHIDVDSEREVRDLKDLLKKVLSRVPDNRGTWGELKGHVFFRGVNWGEVGGRRGGAKMPVVDRVKGTSYNPRKSTGGDGDYSVEFCAESRRA